MSIKLAMPNSTRLKWLLVFSTTIYFFVNFQRIAVPGTIFNELQADYQVSAATITGLGAMFMYIYAINQLFSGLLVDRYGGWRVIAWGGLLFALGAVLFPLSNNMVIVFASRALIGFGASGIYLSMVKLMAQNFPKRFPVMLGIVMVIGYSGSIVANAPLMIAVHKIGWRGAMLGAACCVAVAYLGFALLHWSGPRSAVKNVPFSFRPFVEVVKFKPNWHQFMFCSLNFALVYCLQTTIGKKFLEDFCAMRPTEAAGYMSIMAVIASFSSLLAALLCQACGNRRQPFVRFAALALLVSMGLILLALATGVATKLLVILYLVLGGTGNLATINVSIMKDLNSADKMGTAVSFSNFFSYLILAVVCNLSGMLMDLFEPELVSGHLIYGRGSYLATFGVMFLAAVLCTYHAFKVPEPPVSGQ